MYRFMFLRAVGPKITEFLLHLCLHNNSKKKYISQQFPYDILGVKDMM